MENAVEINDSVRLVHQIHASTPGIFGCTVHKESTEHLAN